LELDPGRTNARKKLDELKKNIMSIWANIPKYAFDVNDR